MFQLASSTTIFTAAQAANKKVSDQRLLAVRFTAAKAANKASVSLPRSPCGFTVAQAAKEVIASYLSIGHIGIVGCSVRVPIYWR